ncbi:hypothetical protein [Allonocardiopsis opalescens]|uniref:Uncharacterized protein n=1 Tax=Allonocardiopsis opalescens TaxID=1144618 RepID=A0A2T0PW04_9ACTN|nr:hypothetical protein [Allonocardiopsis opalescens]PRX95610.1 hypothetical protein CLV72_109219 [Allonocardiopsis opalescens]
MSADIAPGARALLETVAAALDIPRPAIEFRAIDRHRAVQRRRAEAARTCIRRALAEGADERRLAALAAELREQLAEAPVDYPVRDELDGWEVPR